MEAHSNFVEHVKGGIVDFDCYERSLSVVFPGNGNGIAPIVAKPTDGIKVRQVPSSGGALSLDFLLDGGEGIAGLVLLAPFIELSLSRAQSAFESARVLPPVANVFAVPTLGAVDLQVVEGAAHPFQLCAGRDRMAD